MKPPRPSRSKVKECQPPTPATARPSSAQPSARISRRILPRTPRPRAALPPGHTINYLTGQPEPPRPYEAPRLPVQGPAGGSVTLDLSGLGIRLHGDSFAFSMPDDSLRALGIAAGDIAVIEPCRWQIREGDLLKVTIDGAETVRQVTFRRKVPFFHAGPGSEPSTDPISLYGISGVVTAVLRTFRRDRDAAPGRYQAAAPTAPGRATTRRR